jgi:16S rRNA (cytosine967-C5)-methyltransferase
VPASPARRAAFRVVRRVLEQEAFADQALHAEAERLEPRERAFARQLAFGTVQRRRTLDHVIGRLATRKRLDGPTRAALQLGLFQLLCLEGVADHAAVDESVQLAKETGGGGPLVNAVLRRAAAEGRALVEDIEDEGVRESYPHWLVDLWRGAYGKKTATKLMRRLNEPAEPALRPTA